MAVRAAPPPRPRAGAGGAAPVPARAAGVGGWLRWPPASAPSRSSSPSRSRSGLLLTPRGQLSRRRGLATAVVAVLAVYVRPGRAPTSGPPSPSPGGWGRSWSIPSGTSPPRGRARPPIFACRRCCGRSRSASWSWPSAWPRSRVGPVLLGGPSAPGLGRRAVLRWGVGVAGLLLLLVNLPLIVTLPRGYTPAPSPRPGWCWTSSPSRCCRGCTGDGRGSPGAAAGAFVAFALLSLALSVGAGRDGRFHALVLALAGRPSS